MKKNESPTFDHMDKILQASELTVPIGIDRQLTFPSLQLQAGELVIMTGNSGSGKSTWMHALAGLQGIASGHVSIANHGQLTRTYCPPDWRQSGVGFIPQRPFFWPSLTVKGNLDLAQWCKGSHGDLQSWVDRMGLTHCMHQQAHSLSLGEQQRLSAIRAFSHDAPVLLADEPTASLDRDNATALIESLRAYQQVSQCAVLLATHDASLAAMADRIIELPSPS
jgi:putative ABC transport system ATP-binding protein